MMCFLTIWISFDDHYRRAGSKKGLFWVAYLLSLNRYQGVFFDVSCYVQLCSASKFGWPRSPLICVCRMTLGHANESQANKPT